MASTPIDPARLADLARMMSYARDDTDKAMVALEVDPAVTDREVALCTAFGITPLALLLAKDRVANDAANRLASASNAAAVAEATKLVDEARAIQAQRRNDGLPPIDYAEALALARRKAQGAGP